MEQPISTNPRKYDKAKAAFYTMLSALGSIGGISTAHLLLYFLDFDYYEAFETSFTGETYVASPRGPAPQHFGEIIADLHQDRVLEPSDKILFNDIVFYPQGSSEVGISFLKTFTGKEEHILMRTIVTYGHLTGQELRDLAMSQAPYRAVELEQEIPYEFSFYRDTPDLQDLQKRNWCADS